MGQLAQANFILKNYAAVISHSTTVLEYYRDRLDITEESITKLVLLRCQSQLAQLQWDAWLQDREWVQRFTLIFGNTPELNFLTKLYSAWENRDPESYQHSCREFDRAFQMTDEQIRILMLGKEKLVELVSTRLKAWSFPSTITCLQSQAFCAVQNEKRHRYTRRERQREKEKGRKIDRDRDTDTVKRNLNVQLQQQTFHVRNRFSSSMQEQPPAQ